MVRLSAGTFRCVLLTPLGKLLDCRAGALVLPGHDGAMGVLRNHAPMLCGLGIGIMQVKHIPDRKDAFFLLDSGFARISENFISVLAHNVTTFEDMDPDQAEEMVTKARQLVVGQAYMRHQLGEVDFEKAMQIVRMGKMAGIITTK